MFRYFIRSAAALALLCPPPAAHAQANPDSVKHRNDCRLAIQVLTTGQPANKWPWALRVAPSCEAPGGAAIAEVLRHRSNAGSPADIEPLIWASTHLRDRSIFETALAVASDRGATIPARVQAVRILSAQLNPLPPAVGMSYLYYSGERERSMTVYLGETTVTTDEPSFSGEPLPDSAIDEAERSMRSVRSDPGSPAAVSHAASVLLAQLQGFRLCAGVSEQECERRLEGASEN